MPKTFFPNHLKIFLVLCSLLFVFNSAKAELQLSSLSEDKKIKSEANNRSLDLTKAKENYSFIVGGHFFGALADKERVKPSSTLLDYLPDINAQRSEFLFALGDSLRTGSHEEFAAFQKYFARKVRTPIFSVIGNHDDMQGKYQDFFGEKYFYFIYGSDLFIALDTVTERGKVAGEQLDLFLALLDQAQNDEIKNVFIFSHNPVWAKANMHFRPFYKRLNTHHGYEDINYNAKIKKDIEKLAETKAVYWFASDIGSLDTSMTMFYNKNKDLDLHFVATGIADTKRDGLLRVDVADEIKISIIPLTHLAFEEIETYSAYFWDEFSTKVRLKDALPKSKILKFLDQLKGQKE